MRRRTRTNTELNIGRVPKEYRALIAEAVEQGFVLERRSGGHLALKSPLGGIVFFSSSPADGGRFSARKILADLRRHGLRWPPS